MCAATASARRSSWDTWRRRTRRPAAARLAGVAASLRLADAAPEARLDEKALRLARMLSVSRPDPASLMDAGMDLRWSAALLGLGSARAAGAGPRGGSAQGGTAAACVAALTRAEVRNPETLSAAESGYLGRARVALAGA